MSDISLDAIEQLESVLDAKSGGGPNSSATGRVTRVDADGTAWVHVFGGEGETPLRAYGSAVRPGDVVGVEQRGNGLYASGNWSRPSTDDEAANAAQRTADAASSTAAWAVTASQSAKRAADEAQAVADATAQHFFTDTDGVHVTEAEQDVWAQQHSGKNILINSLGILLRNALNNLVSITASAIAFFDGSGNAAANVVAQFGGSGAQIGKSGESHMELDYHKLLMVDKNSNEYLRVEDLRGSDGTGEIVDTFTGDGTTKKFYMSMSAVNTSYTVSVSDSSGGAVTKTSATVTFASAPTDGAVITVTYTTNSSEAKAFTFGERNSSANVGALSFSEGKNIKGGGYISHAEGQGTETSSMCAHAEGISTKASGIASHSEGQGSIASGDNSHAQNHGTVAASDDQTAIGRFNANNSANAFEIGNGTSDSNPSNAFAVDWDGYIYPMAEKMPDWVVAQGTSGIWTYRKWHSGIAECWGVHAASFAVNTSSAAYGGYRSAEQTATFPSGLFTSTPSATATGGAGYAGCWVSNAQSTSSTAFKFFASCGTSLSSSSRSTHIHAIGKWK